VGAQTCINFNGNLTPYFPCQRGFRQGDPLSPFMFDLVTDALCQIIIRGRDAGLIQGLGPVLDNGHNIINFHYTDDTIFFLKEIASVLKQYCGHCMHLRFCQESRLILAKLSLFLSICLKRKLQSRPPL
jgi:Reverse transcriptase (RNA-dependent DNA polymerase)